jgi:hypothetical protein
MDKVCVSSEYVKSVFRNAYFVTLVLKELNLLSITKLDWDIAMMVDSDKIHLLKEFLGEGIEVYHEEDVRKALSKARKKAKAKREKQYESVKDVIGFMQILGPVEWGNKYDYAGQYRRTNGANWVAFDLEEVKDRKIIYSPYKKSVNELISNGRILLDLFYRDSVFVVFPRKRKEYWEKYKDQMIHIDDVRKDLAEKIPTLYAEGRSKFFATLDDIQPDHDIELDEYNIPLLVNRSYRSPGYQDGSNSAKSLIIKALMDSDPKCQELLSATKMMLAAEEGESDYWDDLLGKGRDSRIWSYYGYDVGALIEKYFESEYPFYRAIVEKDSDALCPYVIQK